tara:strand:- start:211 stop:393 length:183 start_codon:yes stop_codon:yes gene_type:complete
MITLESLKNAIADIKESEKEWVNDSHSKSEYEGVCQGLDMLGRHFQEISDAEKMEQNKNA